MDSDTSCSTSPFISSSIITYFTMFSGSAQPSSLNTIPAMHSIMATRNPMRYHTTEARRLLEVTRPGLSGNGIEIDGLGETRDGKIILRGGLTLTALAAAQLADEHLSDQSPNGQPTSCSKPTWPAPRDLNPSCPVPDQWDLNPSCPVTALRPAGQRSSRPSK